MLDCSRVMMDILEVQIDGLRLMLELRFLVRVVRRTVLLS